MVLTFKISSTQLASPPIEPCKNERIMQIFAYRAAHTNNQTYMIVYDYRSSISCKTLSRAIIHAASHVILNGPYNLFNYIIIIIILITGPRFPNGSC